MVIEYILGPNVWPFEAAAEELITKNGYRIDFGALRGAI
jgi:hypothetical protein